jgi:hypothetical protein
MHFNSQGATMRKALVLTAILFVLAGCATTANYEKILSSWVGFTELDIIRKWGPPQQSYETGGRKFLVYSSARNMYLPGTAPSYTTTVIGNTAYTNRVGGTPGQNIGLSCQTTFEISDEKIVSWRWQGNDCTALK